jgi:hypothetical protein
MTAPAILSRTLTNTFGETRADAQYIGDLNNFGTFDIALNGTLAKRDKGDFYSFRVTSSSADLRLATIDQASGSTSSSTSSTAPSNLTDLISSGQLRYQLYTSTGKLIADSNPNAGDLHTAYQNLTNATNLSLNRGTYTIKVSPGNNAVANTAYDYIFSLQASGSPIPDNAPLTSREEFQTTAGPATTNTNPLTSQGWLPTVLTPTNTASSMFSALGNYVTNPGTGGSINLLA